MAVISAQLSEPPPSLSARVPGLPAAADRVIAKALAKSPADRYDRCLDFAEALLAACRLEATGGASVAGVPYSPTRAAAPVTPATAADADRPGPVQAPSASPGYPPAGAGYPAAGAGFPAAGADFPPPPPAGFRHSRPSAPAFPRRPPNLTRTRSDGPASRTRATGAAVAGGGRAVRSPPA